jgi:hypothetical protein
MNTYLTSLLVDLLAPVARHRGLEDALARARRHLAAQIEGNGLVRYHGVPSGPTIGTLGCVIPPDSDDTALVWRIAGRGAADPRARRMLRKLARYRDWRGLYRTWLSPPVNYDQCLDLRRHHANPADRVIQMHIYLMLRALEPTAARDLCGALRRSAGDQGDWVYYERAPIVPYLRGAQLRQLGCRLALPRGRLARVGPGQRLWSDVVTRVVATSVAKPNPTARRAIDDLLTRLSAHDFTLVRRRPPLLYHDDLRTAAAPRFYWSEDAGYALWLRLYEAAHRVTG